MCLSHAVFDLAVFQYSTESSRLRTTLNSVLFVSVLEGISVGFNEYRNMHLMDHHGFSVILTLLDFLGTWAVSASAVSASAVSVVSALVVSTSAVSASTLHRRLYI
jgi:hypothetical protein